MQVTSNFGRVLGCIICDSEEIKDYKVFFPPFASAINSVSICWCDKHESEGKEYYDKAESNSLNIKQFGSNS